jgi:hypothetical protein
VTSDRGFSPNAKRVFKMPLDDDSTDEDQEDKSKAGTVRDDSAYMFTYLSLAC